MSSPEPVTRTMLESMERSELIDLIVALTETLAGRTKPFSEVRKSLNRAAAGSAPPDPPDDVAQKVDAVFVRRYDELQKENERLRAERDHFSEVADTRHDQLSDERREVDRLRALLITLGYQGES